MSNKIFKKCSSLLSVALVSMSMTLITSCNDWLDVEPSTEVDRSKMFQNEDGFADALAGIYNNMTSNNLYGKNLTWYGLDLMGGQATCMYGDPANYAGYYFHPESSYYMESLRNAFVDQIWNEGYTTIANVNSLLEGIEENKNVFSGDDYNIFKGEALGLRAFLHFDLLRLFGPAGTVNPDAKAIPYVDELAAEVFPLLTVRQCADAIVKDLNEAKELLKSDPMFTGSSTFSKYVCSQVTGNATYRERYNIYDWHNRRFHFNYYAAVATMARVYHWMGDSQNALSCAKEVIAAQPEKFPWVNPTLVANVASTSQYVSRDRTFSTEQIFALNITDLEDKADGILIEKTKTFSGGDGNVVGFLTDCFDAASRNYDPRYTYLRLAYNLWGTDYSISKKYYKDNDYENRYSPWSANRLPLIRVSEMYYIAAECESNLNTSLNYLESVRRNRGLSAYPLNINSQAELQEQIEMEYRKEFIAEGQMFYYKKRRNETITTGTEYDENIIPTSLFTLPIPDDEMTYGGRN